MSVNRKGLISALKESSADDSYELQALIRAIGSWAFSDESLSLEEYAEKLENLAEEMKEYEYQEELEKYDE